MKLRAKAGTNNVDRCAFCEYWTGDAGVNYLGNNQYEYEQSVYGLCRAKHDLKKKANDKCSNVSNSQYK